MRFQDRVVIVLLPIRPAALPWTRGRLHRQYRSIGAFQASHNRAAYIASKGVAVSLTKALAVDLAEKNVRVNAVAPGLTETHLATGQARVDIYELGSDLTPMRRWGHPDEIAAAVLFLASDEASFVTGTILSVDGGLLAGSPIGRPFPVREDKR